MNHDASKKAVAKMLKARLDGPIVAEVDQRVVADELDETPVQLMFLILEPVSTYFVAVGL